LPQPFLKKNIFKDGCSAATATENVFAEVLCLLQTLLKMRF
jgi:hypothetical protein